MSQIMRFRSVLSSLLVVIASVSCSKAPSEAIQDPTGYFTFRGVAPKGFEEIDWIVVNPKAPDKAYPHDSNWGSDFPHGLISFKNKKRVKFQSFSITGNDLRFESAPIAGVSYKFEGSFGPEKAFDDVQKELSALTGSLTKHSSQGDIRTKAEFNWFNGD